MWHEAFVLAYHGCDREVGERILSGKADVRQSKNDYDWLGNGAYFWESSPERAAQWAESLKRRGQIKESFVLGVILAPGHCLDLSNAACLDILKSATMLIEETWYLANKKLPVNEEGHPNDKDLVKRKLDCALINFLHDFREEAGETPYETVRCPFFEGEPIYPGSNIGSQTHIQWCVRNPAANIIGYFRHRVRDFH